MSLCLLPSLNVWRLPAAAATVLCLLASAAWGAAAEKRDFKDLQGRVLRGSLEKISGDDIVVKKSVDGTLVTLKAGQLSDEDLLYLVRQGFDQSALQNTPRNAPGSVPETVVGLRASLENTLWDWTNADDTVQVGGATVVKQGAWQALRFRPGGRASAWHKDRIVWSGTWEILDARTVRLAVRVARHSENGWDNAALPDDVKVSYQFDQSYFVTQSISSLALEGALGGGELRLRLGALEVELGG